VMVVGTTDSSHDDAVELQEPDSIAGRMGTGSYASDRISTRNDQADAAATAAAAPVLLLFV
jgi:hypothetical protein